MATVLVIEDAEAMVWVYKRILKEHTVIHSIDVKEIPKLIPKVDCVISDFHVPGYDFFQTKKQCELLGKPLILISGGAPEGSHNVQLAKPFDLTELLETMGSMVPG